MKATDSEMCLEGRVELNREKSTDFTGKKGMACGNKQRGISAIFCRHEFNSLHVSRMTFCGFTCMNTYTPPNSPRQQAPSPPPLARHRGPDSPRSEEVAEQEPSTGSPGAPRHTAHQGITSRFILRKFLTGEQLQTKLARRVRGPRGLGQHLPFAPEAAWPARTLRRRPERAQCQKTHLWEAHRRNQN